MNDVMKEALIVAHLAEHPGAHAVDMLCANVIPGAGGTLYYFGALRRLLANGTIERADTPSLWERHVNDFPGAHTPDASLCAFQAVRWRLKSAESVAPVVLDGGCELRSAP